MLVVGVKVVPRLLAEVVRAGSRELFTLCILALALGVAFGSAELFGASLALGAFLAGMVLNESELSHRAGLEALPLRDAFAVLFFVSVGMLFDPAVLVDEPLQVLAVVGIIVVGKSLAAFLIVTGMGFGMRTALLVSAALAQVGEFSFILAALGIALGVLPDGGDEPDPRRLDHLDHAEPVLLPQRRRYGDCALAVDGLCAIRPAPPSRRGRVDQPLSPRHRLRLRAVGLEPGAHAAGAQPAVRGDRQRSLHI